MNSEEAIELLKNIEGYIEYLLDTATPLNSDGLRKILDKINRVRTGLGEQPETKCETCYGSKKVPKREQPCGCVYCICEDVIRCQGCGAKMCEEHKIGGITNPVMVPCPDCQPER